MSVTRAYGSHNDICGFKEGQDFLPRSYLNLPYINNSYFCLAKTCQDYDKSMEGALQNTTSGWYRFNEFIDMRDASFCTGKTVIDYTYTPKMGILF